MYLLEKSAFGVCTYLADKIGLSIANTRVYFIYLSFFTLGISFIFYLFIAYWIGNKNLSKRGEYIFR
jgi:phage shock protein PspC (stress-responsive transcriptional regulator)